MAAAAGQLEEVYRKGIDGFSGGKFRECVDRMSEVLDAVPVHTMALHYLAQSEERLRKEKLDPERYQEGAGVLAEMRTAHMEGDAKRVIEAANTFLTIDPDSLEARWYRRNAETRLTPARTRDGSVVSGHRRPKSFTTPDEIQPTLVLPAKALPGGKNRSSSMWVLGGAGVLFLALIALVLGFGGSLRSLPETNEPSSSKVRVSPFDDMENDVVIRVPQEPAPEEPPPFQENDTSIPGMEVLVPQAQDWGSLPPSVNSVFPKALSPGMEVPVRLFGSNFSTNASLEVDSGTGGVEVLASQVVTTTLIEATIRLPSGTMSPPRSHRNYVRTKLLGALGASRGKKRAKKSSTVW